MTEATTFEGGSLSWPNCAGGFPPARPEGPRVINLCSEGPTLRKGPLPRSGIAFLGVHRRQTAEVELQNHHGGEDWCCFSGCNNRCRTARGTRSRSSPSRLAAAVG